MNHIPCTSFFTVAFFLLLPFTGLTASAHAVTPITPSGLQTHVSPAPSPPVGKTQYDITGGTRPDGGTNLFHSFGNFNVPHNSIANFLNDTPHLPTANILGRVTGGNLSHIFGSIQTTGFGDATLFLINPAGFVFGPNATLNVGGSVHFTSADYLRLADGARFNAVAHPAPDALLSPAPVAAFGFLGSTPGAITVQGSHLSVPNGTGLSLVGGNIRIQSGTPEEGTLQPARLMTPNGTMHLASAASPGAFDAATLQPLPNVHQTSFTSFGSVSLAPGSHINVSSQQTVSIRGGQFVLSMNDAVLSTAQSPEPPAMISLSPGSSILSSNAKADAGADVQLIASNVQLDGASIQSLTTGNERGGTISITAVPDGGPGMAGTVEIKGGQIQTASVGPGIVGDIQIHSTTLSLRDGALIDSLLVPNPLMTEQPGGGTIALTATDSIVISGQRPGTTNPLPLVPGLPTFMNLPSGLYSENLSANTGSHIVIQTPSLTLQPGGIDSLSFGAGAAGNLTLLLGQLTLDGGSINSIAFGAGPTGSIRVRAADSIAMSDILSGILKLGPLVVENAHSGITTFTLGSGQAGPVFVSTPTLTSNGGGVASSTVGLGGSDGVNVQAGTIFLTEGAAITSSALGFDSGPGGTVSVTASEQLSISGRTSQPFSFGPLTVANNPSSISSVTFGAGRAGAVTVNTPRLTIFNGGDISTSTGGDGQAGSIIVNAGSLNVSRGASISSSSGFNTGLAAGFLFGNGAGGSVTVNATGPVTMADPGSGIFTTTVGNGAGGNINLRGSSIQLNNGAAISATSTGKGNAGGITVNASNHLTLMNSSITTEANQSSGGAIKIITNPNGIVQLAGSTISSSVLDGAGGGGSVNIDPQLTVLHNSQILAQAVQGSGGNILITTNILLQDATSLISASSQVGQQGTTSIQSPIASLAENIIPLSQKPLITAPLISQACAARDGGMFSTFTLRGRERLPPEPDGWLVSPLILATPRLVGRATELNTRRTTSESAPDTTRISLRRISPPGFLTQSFAMNSSTGCSS